MITSRAQHYYRNWIVLSTKGPLKQVRSNPKMEAPPHRPTEPGQKRTMQRLAWTQWTRSNCCKTQRSAESCQTQRRELWKIKNLHGHAEEIEDIVLLVLFRYSTGSIWFFLPQNPFFSFCVHILRSKFQRTIPWAAGWRLSDGHSGSFFNATHAVTECQHAEGWRGEQLVWEF